MTSTEAQDLNRRVKPPGCVECPVAGLHSSFIPDEGDPESVLICEIAEAGGADEAVMRRPLVGPSGRLDETLWLEVGLPRAARLLGNTIRCHPPNNIYPVGKEKTAAEACCRQYDGKIRDFGAKARLCTYHPAVLFRQPNLLKFVRRAYELAARSERSQVLLGARSRGVFWPALRGAEKRWQRHHDGLYPLVARQSVPLSPGIRGVDLEYSGTQPTILGVADMAGSFSIPWDEQEAREQCHGQVVVGHFFLTADLPVLRQFGIEPAEVIDTAVLFYLTNAELCKDAPKDDRDSIKGQGHMDIWSMASLYTDLPNWKECRGRGCSGPCPKHDVFGYNGLDALAPLIALPKLREDVAAKSIPETLIRHVSRLMLFCKEIQQKGITIDREYLKVLSDEADAKRGMLFPWHHETKPRGTKQHVVWDAPFSPESWQQIGAYFKSQGIALASTDLDAIESTAKRCDDPWLHKLLDYKSLGKDPGAWFGSVGKDKRIHPRFNPLGTSPGRLSSSRPNFQNVKRGALRRGVISRLGTDLLIADYSQLELRMCLWAAGQREPLGGDAFRWLVENSDGAFERVAEANRVTHPKWTARDWAKSVSHAADYLEGIIRLKTRTARGPTKIHHDWEFLGGWVGFTGANLALRLFGNKSHAARAEALAIQELYFSRFPILRAWHKSITQQAAEGWMRSASGRYLTLDTLPGLETKYASEVAKQAAAFIGQGQSADYVLENMLQFDGESLPILQVHDELVFEIPDSWSTQRALEFVRPMTMKGRLIEGFSCPVKVKRGKNWLDAKEIGSAG